MANSNRDYAIPDADLMMFVSNLVQTMTRDALLLADYSVDVADITALQVLGNQFEVFPPDTFYQADVGVATADKDNKRIELIQATRKITNRALAKWGINSAQYNKFGVKGITDMSDKELLATSRLVVLAAESYLSQLASEGLLQSIIDDYEDLSQQFETLLNAFNNALEIRDVKTKERIALGNQLYALVSRYCIFGKTIWENVDEAKFNDYLIYTGSSPGSLQAPTGISFNLANMKISWDTLENAISYIASISTDGGASYQEVYSGSDTFFVYQPTYFGEITILVKGHNSGGNGPASYPYTFTYFDVLPAPEGLTISLVSETTGLIRLNFEDVASATTYKIFRSVVGLGMPEGEFTYISEQPGNEYVGNTTAGMRNWFHVKAGNATQLSVASAAVFMDMAVVPE